MDQVKPLIDAIISVANASNFTLIVKIIFILAAITSGIWFRYLKRKFSRKAARSTEQENSAKNEIEIRNENTIENQQASSDSSKIDDLLK